MGLDEFIMTPKQTNTEHPAIKGALNEAFESGFVDEKIRQELATQAEEFGIELECGWQLPHTPYQWDATVSLSEKWQTMVAEHVLCDESHPQHRFQQAASRATEHLDCGSGNTITSALSRQTFFESFEYDGEEVAEPVHFSAPSAGLIRTILVEVERLLRQQPDIIEQILNYHEIE